VGSGNSCDSGRSHRIRIKTTSALPTRRSSDVEHSFLQPAGSSF
jgi:hypothetical protein